jgi:hypothetical protein
MARLDNSTAASLKILSLVLLALAPIGCRQGSATPQTAVVVAVPAKAGVVEGKAENSDTFIWKLFTDLVAPVSKDRPSPVIFETWASDKDTFSAQPHWPKAGEPMELQRSVLAETKTLGNDSPANPHPETELLAKIHASISSATSLTHNTEAATRLEVQKIDVNCEEPPGAAVGGFPTGDPSLCIAEQVSRNYPQWNYIVSNHLNTQAGLKEAYAKSINVEMPTDSVAIKGDWVPLPALLKWVPQIGDVSNIKKLYYTAVVAGTEYALVAMHVSSRQNPNWVWGTFEHQLNPGRCDYIGCFDSFGALTAEIVPNKSAVNTQYGACPKTEQLKTLMASANLAPVWGNYCLKSTQVDYMAADGTPFALGNSVIEGVVGNGTVAASSCISCHAYASFGPNGTPTKSALKVLPFNPTGKPIPGVLAGSHTYAFMWGVLQAK